MNRYCAVGLVTLCLAASVAVIFSPRSAEPVYAGRPVSEWLDGGYEQISMALHETGPAAATCVFFKLRQEHPTYGRWAMYRKIWTRAPGIIRRFLPKPKSCNFDDARACSALLDIGPSVIPALAVALKDPNPAVKIASAWALGTFRQRGSDITASFPHLIQTLHDPNPDVRYRAAWASGF
jgi:hypothetical protein